MTYLIFSRPRGSKSWASETLGYRYGNIEAAEAHLTYLRFNNRKTEYQVRRDEDWTGPIRSGFKAEETKPKTVTMYGVPIVAPLFSVSATGVMTATLLAAAQSGYTELEAIAFRPMADPPEAYRADSLMTPWQVTAEQPRGRRPRNGST